MAYSGIADAFSLILQFPALKGRANSGRRYAAPIKLGTEPKSKWHWAASPAHFHDYKDLHAKKRVSLCSSFINPKVFDILTCETAPPALPGRKLQK
jgi:hypothetical protein